jgi:hypothetical protein
LGDFFTISSGHPEHWLGANFSCRLKFFLFFLSSGDFAQSKPRFVETTETENLLKMDPDDRKPENLVFESELCCT